MHQQKDNGVAEDVESQAMLVNCDELIAVKEDEHVAIAHEIVDVRDVALWAVGVDELNAVNKETLAAVGDDGLATDRDEL